MKDYILAALTLMLAACALSTSAVPAPPPPTPRAIEELIPTRLEITSPVRQTLDALADGLIAEFALCLTGFLVGHVAVVTDIEVPQILHSDATSVAIGNCGPRTLAIWHNHPHRLAEVLGYPLSAFCALSGNDMSATLLRPHPFVVVQVDSRHICWWSKEQIKAAGFEAQVIGYFDKIEGQFDIPPQEVEDAR